VLRAALVGFPGSSSGVRTEVMKRKGTFDRVISNE
jgi:hypothetical protein